MTSTPCYPVQSLHAEFGYLFFINCLTFLLKYIICAIPIFSHEIKFPECGNYLILLLYHPSSQHLGFRTAAVQSDARFIKLHARLRCYIPIRKKRHYCLSSMPSSKDSGVVYLQLTQTLFQ